jgi:hypothetical protein
MKQAGAYEGARSSNATRRLAQRLHCSSWPGVHLKLIFQYISICAAHHSKGNLTVINVAGPLLELSHEVLRGEVHALEHEIQGVV